MPAKGMPAEYPGTISYWVDSKAIKMLGWCSAKAAIIVQFQNGSTYAYHNLDELFFNLFKGSDSIGKFYHRFVRNRRKEFNSKRLF